MGWGDGGLVTSGRWLSAPFDGGIEPREVLFRVTFHWRSASASARPPVLIADRRPVSRQLIRFLLEQDRFDVLGEASTVTDVLRSVTTHRPDALVVNDNVPAAPGTDPIREIRRLSPSTKVVLISSERLEGSPWQGADAILEEEVSVRQLTRVLAQILAGVAVIAPASIGGFGSTRRTRASSGSSTHWNRAPLRRRSPPPRDGSSSCGPKRSPPACRSNSSTRRSGPRSPICCRRCPTRSPRP